MINTNRSKESHQQKEKQNQEQLKVFRKDWEARKLGLVEEKEKLGYGEISIEDFLKLSPPISDASSETVSKFIKLQSDFEELEDTRQVLWFEEFVVEELNKKHAMIHTDQSYMLTEKCNPVFGGTDFTLESKQSFRNQYENKSVQCPDGRMRTKADIWLKSPLRREYKGIIFDPKQDIAGYYNLWKGFSIKPFQGNCSKYWEHVLTNICNSNHGVYLFVRKWTSSIFQKPDEVHTALVLCGSQGTGKNSFVEPLGILLGQHYVLLSSLSELVSHFNYHLKHAVLIHANEALWGGDRRDIGTLKAMITERTCLIEGKGKDRFMVRNFKHVILSSNESWPVSLDADDRRFFVLNVSEAHKEDHAYFAAMEKQLKSGGYEALLFDLLNENLDGFNPRMLPENIGAFDIKLRSANSAHKYIYEALLEVSFGLTSSGNGGIWQSLCIKDIFDDYCFWCKANGEKNVNREIFGKELQKLIPSIQIVRPNEGGKRPRKYSFPDLEVARTEFCKAYKVGPEIWKEEEFDAK